MTSHRDLAGILAVPVYRRVSESLLIAFHELREEHLALSESQQIVLVKCALQCIDGVRAELEGSLEHVETLERASGLRAPDTIPEDMTGGTE